MKNLPTQLVDLPGINYNCLNDIKTEALCQNVSAERQGIMSTIVDVFKGEDVSHNEEVTIPVNKIEDIKTEDTSLNLVQNITAMTRNAADVVKTENIVHNEVFSASDINYNTSGYIKSEDTASDIKVYSVTAITKNPINKNFIG